MLLILPHNKLRSTGLGLICHPRKNMLPLKRGQADQSAEEGGNDAGAGRPCKERLLRVLYDSEAASWAAETLGEKFEVKNFDSASPALAILTAVGIPVEIWP